MPDGDHAIERLLSATLALEHRHWCEARGKLLRALRAGRRCVAVLGPPGTGKTLLLRDVGRALARETTTPVRNVAESGSPAVLVVAVGPSGIALIDDGDRLSDATLAALTAPGGPQCVLAGPTEFAVRLTRLVADLEIVGLAPLPPNEASAYLAMWLMRGGLPPNRFEARAMATLVSAASGVPRSLNQLAGRAEWLATEDHARRVAERHVLAATLSLLDSGPAPLPAAAPGFAVVPWAARGALAAGLALLLVCGAIAVRAIVPSSLGNATGVATSGTPLRAAPDPGLFDAISATPPVARMFVASDMRPRVVWPAERPPAFALAAATVPVPAMQASASAVPPLGLAAMRAVDRPRLAAQPSTAPALSLVSSTPLLPLRARLVSSNSPPGRSMWLAGARQPADSRLEVARAVQRAPMPALVLWTSITAALPTTAPMFVNTVEADQPDRPAPSALAAMTAPVLMADMKRFSIAPAGPASHLAEAIPLPGLVIPATATAPGLLLVARDGETLASMYGRIYQGVVPPPFETVAAVNPKRVKPGDVLTFPSPPGGWIRQRQRRTRLPRQGRLRSAGRSIG